MKAIEKVLDEMVYEKADGNVNEVMEKFINKSIDYVGELIELRPQRAYKLSMVINRLNRYNKDLIKGTNEYDYWEIIEELADIHRTSKEIKRQMTQQFGKRPNYKDLVDVLHEGSSINAKQTMDELLGRE